MDRAALDELRSSYGSTGATVSGESSVSATMRLIGPASGLYGLTVSSATATSGICEKEGTVHPHMFSAVSHESRSCG
jgi:hypothetical protein